MHYFLKPPAPRALAKMSPTSEFRFAVTDWLCNDRICQWRWILNDTYFRFDAEFGKVLRGPACPICDYQYYPKNDALDHVRTWKKQTFLKFHYFTKHGILKRYLNNDRRIKVTKINAKSSRSRKKNLLIRACKLCDIQLKGLQSSMSGMWANHLYRYHFYDR